MYSNILYHYWFVDIIVIKYNTYVNIYIYQLYMNVQFDMKRLQDW